MNCHPNMRILNSLPSMKNTPKNNNKPVNTLVNNSSLLTGLLLFLEVFFILGRLFQILIFGWQVIGKRFCNDIK